jgi:hypothetical protein
MSSIDSNPDGQAVLGQKYAYATASLILGIASYVQILGLEKAILAIVFAWLALKRNPAPLLREHRGWAKIGLALGSVVLVLLPTVLILNLDRIRPVVDALMKLQNAK